MAERTLAVPPAEAYEPGAFFRRELPALLKMLRQAPVPLAETIVVVDGYVDLGDRPGLGAHLATALTEEGIPAKAVVGVAKNPFRSASPIEVFRGGSKRPLFVTAVGMDAKQAAHHVEKMAGPHRFPLLLQRVDALSRGRA